MTLISRSNVVPRSNKRWRSGHTGNQVHCCQVAAKMREGSGSHGASARRGSGYRFAPDCFERVGVLELLLNRACRKITSRISKWQRSWTLILPETSLRPSTYTLGKKKNKKKNRKWWLWVRVKRSIQPERHCRKNAHERSVKVPLPIPVIRDAIFLSFLVSLDPWGWINLLVREETGSAARGQGSQISSQSDAANPSTHSQWVVVAIGGGQPESVGLPLKPTFRMSNSPRSAMETMLQECKPGIDFVSCFVVIHTLNNEEMDGFFCTTDAQKSIHSRHKEESHKKMTMALKGCHNQERGINFVVLRFCNWKSGVGHKSSPFKLWFRDRFEGLRPKVSVKTKRRGIWKCWWQKSAAGRRVFRAAESRGFIAQYRRAHPRVCVWGVSLIKNTWYLRLTLFINKVMQDTAKPWLVTSPNWLWHVLGNKITWRAQPRQRGHGLNRSFITLIRRTINSDFSTHTIPPQKHRMTVWEWNSPDGDRKWVWVRQATRRVFKMIRQQPRERERQQTYFFSLLMMTKSAFFFF